MEHIENDDQFGGLTVNKGVSQPPVVNPYLKRRKRKGAAERGRTRGRNTQGRHHHPRPRRDPRGKPFARPSGHSPEVIEKCLPHSGKSRRIGITGVPGAGKSTSIDVFGLHVLKGAANLPCLPSIRQANAPKGVFSATRPAWRNFRCTLTPLSAPALRQDRSAAWPARRERP